MFGLIHQDTTFFEFMGMWNLDAENTTGECMAPFSHPQRYMLMSTVVTIGFCIALAMAWPLWNLLRTYLPTRLWAYLEAPPIITTLHLRRAMVHIYLTLFAPMTIAALNILICKSPCTSGCGDPDQAECGCAVLNAIDMSTVCWAGDHVPAAVFAAVTLVLYCILMPILLIVSMRIAAKHRDESLKLRTPDAKKIFKSLDDPPNGNGDGILQSLEIEKMLEDIGAHKTFTLVDEDGDGKIEWGEFENWFKHYISTHMHESCLDMLCVMAKSRARWWFLEMLGDLWPAAAQSIETLRL